MALDLQFKITEDSGCKSWKLSDITGDYDATSNPGGWGTPNPQRGDDMKIDFVIQQNGDSIGYKLHIECSSVSISVFTITAPDGTTTDWYSWLNDNGGYTCYVDGTATLKIIPKMLGLGDDDSFVANTYYFIETINDLTTENILVGDLNQLIVCSQCCCLDNMVAALEVTDCECQNNKVELAIQARIFLDAANIAMNNGDIQKSTDLMKKSKDLCADNCTDC